MSASPIPEHERLSRRWRQERLLMWVAPVFYGVCGVTLVLSFVLVFGRAWLITPVLIAGLIAWIGAAGVLVGRYLRTPTPAALVKRADHMIGLPDNLLSLSETTQSSENSEWREATERATRQKLADCDLAKNWPLRFSRAAWWSVIFAFVLSGLLNWMGWMRLEAERVRLASEDAERKARLAASEEVLRDWEDFSKLTEDEELKKFFTDAGRLREAIASKDPMAAMLEMNRMEQAMSSLQESIQQESISGQSGSIAEALEAFEGMGAMSAALRNKSFDAASDEAQKLGETLDRNKSGSSALRRDAAVAEMLATESQNAANRSNHSLSQSLEQMSKSAAQAGNKGSVPNAQLGPPVENLRNQFSQEASRQLRGRALSLSKEQLESLRRRLRGETDDRDRLLLPSLCRSCGGSQPGGKKAGRGSGGDPKGDATKLADAAKTQGVTGAAGEGESEVRTTSANSGSGGKVAGGKQAAFSDYVELSRQAVADENLPLAHRRVIQMYFERIRPVAETPKP